ncbi:MAG: leucine-rich repeat domain-containing protein [Lachnospiraceae bacterium]|nr:leucine-rich repeat domain-containing protein [Lachnospiraceae bacterium]
MKRKRKLLGVILIVSALLVLQLPPAGVDAASIPEFSITGSGTLISYNGTSADVVIPSSVIEIATDAFRDNDNIRSVVIPNSVKKINEYAFWDCDNLQTVSIGSGLTKIDDFVFANCMGLISVNIPANIRSVGIYAFEDDVNLEAVTFTQYTHDIHKSSFDGCYKLVIFAPEGSYAWDYAQEFYVRQAQFPVYEDIGYIADEDVPVVYPDGTVRDSDGNVIPVNDVSGNDSSQGDGQQSGGDSDDAGNANDEEPGAYTTQFEITQRPDGTYTAVATGQNPNIYGETHVVGNAAVVFMDNSSFHVVDGSTASSQTPSSGQDDGDSGEDSSSRPSNTVTYSSAIPKYTIVDNTIVADKAYYLSTDLENMSLPGGIREIGQFAFSRTRVMSVTLPDGVERIDYGAFYHCDMLEEVSLPTSVMRIEPYAFSETPWVRNFLSSRGSINNNLDDDLNSSAGEFLVSGGALIAYRGAGTNVTIPSGVRIIAAGAFRNNKNIRTVAFPDTLISIGEEAFFGCTSLAEVSFGGNETEILDRAFGGTLVSVNDKPARILNVGVGAFDDLATVEGLNITYEETTQRLSNVSLRPSVIDRENAGVTVLGLPGCVAYLDGADRPYTLSVSMVSSSEVMNAALQRASGFLEDYSFGDMLIYDLVLTDSSNIPLAKLGNQGLEVAIPITDELKGENLIVLTCDRNGQLEDIPVEIVNTPSGQFARFVTYHLSPFALVSVGNDLSGQIIESDVVLRANSGGHKHGAYAGNSIKNWFIQRGAVRLLICGMLALTGIFLLSLRKKKA